MNKNIIQAEYITTGSYQEIFDYQLSYFQPLVNLKSEKGYHTENTWPLQRLLFVEHHHVYTLGKSGKIDHLLADKQWLSKHQVEFHETTRGGDITYHGPGQLVVYPILDLDNFYHDIHKYMRALEEVVIKTIAEFDIVGERLEKATGVWLDLDQPSKTRKICAMGVKLSRWVSMHGIGFNINTDLDFFNRIVPCGITDKGVTSLAQEIGQQVPMNNIIQIFSEKFEEVFDVKVRS